MDLSIAANERPRIINVIGGDIPQNYGVGAKTSFNTYENSLDLQSLDRPTPVDVLDMALDADILHFTCHGFIDEDTDLFNLQLGDYPSIHSNLNGLVLQDSKRRLRGKPIVFVNACSSANIYQFLGQARYFVWDFYGIGAKDYIGTLAHIPTGCAIRFAKLFYKELFYGKTIGEALYWARQHFAKQDYEQNNLDIDIEEDRFLNCNLNTHHSCNRDKLSRIMVRCSTQGYLSTTCSHQFHHLY